MADDSAMTDIVRRAAQANATLVKGWMDLSLEYMRAMSEIFGGATAARPSTPTEEMDAGTSTLVLEGEAGASATGSFLVSNDLDRPISCKLTYSDFADPTGASAKVRATFEPASLELAPGAQQVVKVSVVIGDALTPGVGYSGEIAIAGMDGFAVPVVLRRQHTLEDDARFDADGSDTFTAQSQNEPSTPSTAAAAPSTTSRGKSSPGQKATRKPPVRKSDRRR